MEGVQLRCSLVGFEVGFVQQSPRRRHVRCAARPEKNSDTRCPLASKHTNMWNMGRKTLQLSITKDDHQHWKDYSIPSRRVLKECTASPDFGFIRLRFVVLDC